jgi:hypothetical protein
MTATDAKDGWDVLTRSTQRTIQFAYILFLRREEGLSASSADIAGHFKDCSTDLAASVLHEAADISAVRHGDDGEWHVTPEGLAAMRAHFKGWAEKFDSPAEERGLA